MRLFKQVLLVLLVLPALSACLPAAETSTPENREITVYSGRSEDLIGPIIAMFEEETGIQVTVQYGDTPGMAALIQEEGDDTAADVYISQDAGALGLLANAGYFTALPESMLNRVDERFHSSEGLWVGLTGRARVVAYNPELVEVSELPDSIFGFTEPEWDGRIGWVPGNASFQAFVTAMRVKHGDDITREWLEGIAANNPVAYEGNGDAVQGVHEGEVEVAFVNHYYVFEAEDAVSSQDVNAENYFLPVGDPGALVNISGAAILSSTENHDAALEFVEFLLREQAQNYFSEETFEYPLINTISPRSSLPDLEDIGIQNINLSDLSDLEGTQALLREVGIID